MEYFLRLFNDFSLSRSLSFLFLRGVFLDEAHFVAVVGPSKDEGRGRTRPCSNEKTPTVDQCEASLSCMLLFVVWPVRKIKVGARVFLLLSINTLKKRVFFFFFYPVCFSINLVGNYKEKKDYMSHCELNNFYS